MVILLSGVEGKIDEHAMALWRVDGFDQWIDYIDCAL